MTILIACFVVAFLTLCAFVFRLWSETQSFQNDVRSSFVTVRKDVAGLSTDRDHTNDAVAALNSALLNLTDRLNDQSNRLTRAFNERVDLVEQTLIRLVSDTESALGKETARLLVDSENTIEAKIAKSENRAVQQAHIAVWGDLEGTLMTMRSDFDTSLNARTAMLKDLIEEVKSQVAETGDTTPREKVKQFLTDELQRIMILEEKVKTLEYSRKTQSERLDELAEKVSANPPSPQPASDLLEKAADKVVGAVRRSVGDDVLENVGTEVGKFVSQILRRGGRDS